MPAAIYVDMANIIGARQPLAPRARSADPGGRGHLE